MSSILVTTWDGGGNVPPALGMAVALQDRGHTVRVLGHARQRATVEAAGLRFAPYEQARAWSPTRPAGKAAWALGYLRMFTDRGMGADVAAALRREPADVALIDAMTPAPQRAARDLGVRYAVLAHTLHEYLAGQFAGGPPGLAAGAYGLPVRALWTAADRVLAVTLPALDTPSPAPNVRITGPVWPIGAPPPRPAAPESPRILVSLSSIHYAGQLSVLQAVLDAVAGLPVPVVVTTGHGVEPSALRAPANVELHAYMPHGALLPDVSLVVGHGGHSTTMQALAHDLPVVLLPLTRMSDQWAVGRAVAGQGAGEVLAAGSSPAAIRAAIVRMLADGPHRAAAARLGAQIRAADGAVVAADEIEAVVRAAEQSPRRSG